MSALLLDQELIDAEVELKQARSDKRYDDADVFEQKIIDLEPASYIGAAVKLRLLCDPE